MDPGATSVYRRRAGPAVAVPVVPAAVPVRGADTR